MPVRQASPQDGASPDPVKVTRYGTGDTFSASYCIEIGDDWAVSATVTVKETPGNGFRITIDTMTHPELSRRLENLYIGKIASRALTDTEKWVKQQRS